MDRLAKIHPNIVPYRGQPEAQQTVREAALYARCLDTFYFDRTDFAANGRAFLEAFPDSPRAPFIRDCLKSASS